MVRPALFAFLTLLTVMLWPSALAVDIAIPDLGRRGDLPEGLTQTFTRHLRQEVVATGLSVDQASLVTEGIAGSLDPFYTMLAARLLGTRYALSGEIAASADSDTRFTISLLLVDTEQERHSDVISRPLQLQEMSQVARELAREIVAFTDLSQSLPGGDSGLFISSEPSGASVYINGLLVGSTGELNMLELAPGRYQIELRLDGYLPATRVEELRAGASAFPHFRLTRIIGGSAQVSSSPPAEVYYGGANMGTTPLNLALPAGVQQLELRREGFRDTPVNVDVRNNRVTRVAVDLAPVREPLVWWDAVDGVQIYIDGELQTGTAATDLRPGRVTFRISRDGTSLDYTMVLPLTGAFRLDTELGALTPLRQP